MNNHYFEVLPLFSSPVCTTNISENLSGLSKIISDYDFRPIKIDGSQDVVRNTYVTKNIRVLEDFPHEKNILMQYFISYKNNILKLNTTNFKMTTSWGTKTDANGFSHPHKHQNSIYSGVFYFEDSESAKLEFYSDNTNQIRMNQPTEWNLYNCKTWSIPPKKNMVVFFPSHLMHRISKNNSSKPRHSLAFNLFPEGLLGESDSSINIVIP